MPVSTQLAPGATVAHVIVLGGGVARLGEPWRAAVAARLPGLLMEPFRPGPEVRLAALGDAVVPVGAALLALRRHAGDTREGLGEPS